MIKKLSLVLIATWLVANIHAQNGISSPYSRYGFGIQSERAMGFNKGMAGVAQGFRNGQQINIANPASYSAVDSLTALFDLGISLQNTNYKMGGMRQNIRNSSFDYFAFQFRAAKNVGVTTGLLPTTNIKYSFASTSDPLAGNENVTSYSTFSGDGGLREVFLGVGWKPFKPLSIGVNLSYLWGDYTHNMTMAFNESTIFSMARIYTAEISTYNLQGGFQYIQPLNSDDQLIIGGTYTLGHKVENNAYRKTETRNSSSTIETESTDTIKNAFQLPNALAVGVTYYHTDQLRVGVDFELQKWSLCRFPNQSGDNGSDVYTATRGQLNDRWKAAAGIEWTPKSNSDHYFNKCSYKVGGYYAQSYAKADVTGTITSKPSEVGVSAGITMPIANRNTWRVSPKMHFSVQWIHTDIPYLNAITQRQSKLTENYLKFCIGLTFSERWFYKWRVE
ncbi:MAG: hypothetical protein K2H92_03775 [Bacteroidaceae bacterium]|nr:hypothetical protein [Bacteroidaceae bacterium]